MPALPSPSVDGSGERRRVVRLRRAVVLMLGIPVGIAATLLSGPVAHAEDAGPVAVATLDTVEPAVPHHGDTLVLAGMVENTGDIPVRDVQAILRYSAVPLTDRSDVWRVPGDDDLRYGRRYTDFFQELGSPEAELPPGDAVGFRLEVPVDEMNFAEPGVYAVGVDIRAKPPDGERLTLDTARTVITWLPDNQPLPAVPVALLWPLSTRPSMLPDGTLLGDTMAAQVGPDGALTALVHAPGPAPVTWVVDPDLLSTVATMAGGYTVTSAEGSSASGPGAAAAAAWQEAFGAATDGHELLFLPYADPDLPALARAHPEEAARAARQAWAATRQWAANHDVAPVAQISWPGSGVADEASLAALSAAGARTVVLSGSAVDPATDQARTGVRAGETKTLDAVLTDDALGAVIGAAAAAGPAGGSVALRQAWLAETALAALDAEATGRSPAQLVAAPPYGWQPDAATARALIDVWTTTPWVLPTTLADIAAPKPPTTVAPDPVATASPPELPAAQVEAVSDLREQVTRYGALLAEPDSLMDELGLAALRAAATTWRPAPDAGQAYSATATDEVTTLLGQVSVLVPDSVTLSSDKGMFPLTLSNGLSEPVLISVRVEPDYPDRLSVLEVPPQRVEAGENATVEVTAEAAANGRVPVTVRLETADGSAFGVPHRMIVNATDYGTIGWVVVGVAVALFLAASALRLIRTRRHPVEAVDQPETRTTEAEAQQETAR